MDSVTVIAAVWGFAEATLFFIVPDVWLTLVAVIDGSLAVRAGVAALAGAVVGGIATERWGRAHPAGARRAIAAVPGISAAMIDRVDDDVRRQGLRAIFAGPLRGVPYKIYAAAVGAQGRALLPFLLVSIPARVPRMALLTAAAWALGRWPMDQAAIPTRFAVVGALWVAFYSWYFHAMSARSGQSNVIVHP